MTLHHGDCLEVMPTFDAESIDAIVTDPPYDLTSGKRGGSGVASVNLESPYGRARIGTGNGSGGFMGKAWDGTGIAFRVETWAEALRVAKPGAHLLAFGGTRTVHRMMTAIEDAGWEIRDTLVWAYASGFPKSLDVSKAIDKRRADPKAGSRDGEAMLARDIPTPGAYNGWGTALKPAWEPIVMARKPLRGTVAGNVLAFGTGALNIDGTRIEASGRPHISADGRGPSANGIYGDGLNGSSHLGTTDLGRWPANVILTDPIFDGDMPGVVGGGEAASGGKINGRPVTGYMKGWADERFFDGYGDEGTYSRFFLIPKAARSDREPVMGGLAMGRVHPPRDDGRQWDIPGSHSKDRGNTHPTVKPTDLMRHLVRLVTPPGGLVLDPFLGSGTTALAAEMEGFRWVGIEREAEYVAIAEARLNGTQRGLGLVS